MAIVFDCTCGKKVQAPESLAGKRVRCPHCQSVLEVPPHVLDAEEVPRPSPVTAKPRSSPAPQPETFGLQDEADAPALDPDEKRRPCPMCGEMILANAVKCRFCGEVFDETLRETLTVDPELVRQFRREAHGLGGVWVFFGCICLLLAVVAPNMGNVNEAGPVLAVVFGGIGVGWLTLGIFTFLKHLWAIYLGLAVSYVSAVGNLVSLGQGGNACGLIIVVAIIIQAHKVISRANKMKKAGIPLTARPESLRPKRVPDET